ncbi:hypothetical protein PN36_09020 [Candidatus Thiomargarita nelsonii]|uniref:Replication origin-binding protein domain-containing protein n=1 Tax=Candidatus Thiomargarita nelsonii TaxID=1003181 RepID=A0A4E0RTB9_9GAMM|nr:hypothetical protein PN36_09020 [Candidatus Thiomargarita nelsonii]
MSANQLIILETLAKKLCPATKTLTLDANGKPNAINYGRAIKFHGKIYQPTNINELSHLLEFYADIPYALAVRGQFRDHVDLTKPIWRRKDERKYPKAPHTVCLMETALNWLMLDIDKLSLPALGFNAPLSQLDPKTVCDAIIAKYLPELQGITYHFQLSSTAGWFNHHTVSVHLWLWLDKPMTNPECKAFAKMVNARENQQILDPSLYNAAQPHYIANPILGNGVETDPLPVRSGLVKKESDVFSMPAVELTSAKKTPSQKSSIRSSNRPKMDYIRPHKLDDWLKLIRQTDGGIHDILLDITNWRANTGGLWCDWKSFRKKLETAFRESVRAQTDIVRIDTLFNSGEYERAVDGAKTLAKQNFWQNYSSHLVLSHDDTDIIRLNERYLHSFKMSDSVKTLVIDSDLGTGKTEWFYNNVIKDAPLGQNVLCQNPRRSLAKATALRFGIVDYEDAKQARTLMDYRMMSLCINSSLKLVNPKTPADVLFLDESDLIILHLLGGAVPDKIREELIYHNIEITRNAKHVICAQSLVSDLTLSFLKLAGRDDVIKVINTHQPWKSLPIDFFRKKDKALERLLEVADQGTPFLCPCNSSGQALRIFLDLNKRHPEKNYLLLTNDTASEPEQSAFLSDSNKHAHKYDGVIFSPVLESGNSIVSPHFQETIGFCSAAERVGTPESFIQMMLRGRKAKRMSLWVDPQKHDLPTTDERCAREAIARFDVAAKMIVQDGKELIAFEKTPVVDLAMKAKAIENKSKNNTDRVVYALLTERMGCHVNLVDSDLSDLGIEANKQGKQLQKEHYQAQVEKSVKLSPAEYETIKKNRSPSAKETWDMCRYRLEHELCVDLDGDNEAIFELWNQGRVVQSLRGFEEGLLNLDEAKVVAKHLLENKAQYAESQGFMTRWLIRRGIMESLKLSVDDDGNVSCSPEFKFKYSDLMSTWWYRFARQNLDAVNGSQVGCRIRGKRPSESEIGRWIRAMGIVLTRHNVDGTGYANKPLKEKKVDPVPNRHRQSVYSVNLDNMQPLTSTFKRRLAVGATVWASLMTKVMHKDQNVCADAIKALLPELKTPAGKQTVVVLFERLGDRFDWLEINEAYYRLAA